jgi:hypothetical protein
MPASSLNCTIERRRFCFAAAILHKLSPIRVNHSLSPHGRTRPLSPHKGNSSLPSRKKKRKNLSFFFEKLFFFGSFEHTGMADASQFLEI